MKRNKLSQFCTITVPFQSTEFIQCSVDLAVIQMKWMGFSCRIPNPHIFPFQNVRYPFWTNVDVRRVSPVESIQLAIAEIGHCICYKCTNHFAWTSSMLIFFSSTKLGVATHPHKSSHATRRGSKLRSSSERDRRKTELPELGSEKALVISCCLQTQVDAEPKPRFSLFQSSVSVIWSLWKMLDSAGTAQAQCKM